MSLQVICLNLQSLVSSSPKSSLLFLLFALRQSSRGEADKAIFSPVSEISMKKLNEAEKSLLTMYTLGNVQFASRAVVLY